MWDEILHAAIKGVAEKVTEQLIGRMTLPIAWLILRTTAEVLCLGFGLFLCLSEHWWIRVPGTILVTRAIIGWFFWRHSRTRQQW
jgi:hypothetical protein